MRGEGPLRYPGAKSNLAKFVAAFVERQRLVGTALVEPFAGSAAVSRYLLRRRLVERSTLWEADPGAYAFWRSALLHSQELKRRVSLADVTLEEFDRCNRLLFETEGPPENELEAGYAFLFLNRTSYSGIVGAGPIGGRDQSSPYPINCRFNKERILKQLDDIASLNSRVEVNFGDGISALSRSSDSIFYVDPPYFSNGKKFYRKYFTTFDHYRLRKALLSMQGRWLLSYDYDKKVEYLYRDLPVAVVDLYHSARSSGSKREILVSPLGFSGLPGLQMTRDQISSIVSGR